jgi:hypothetical protein
MNSNFNCSYMVMSSLAYILGFLKTVVSEGLTQKELPTKMTPDTAVTSEDMLYTTMTKICE